MKKFLSIILFLGLIVPLAFSQNVVPHAAHTGSVGTTNKPWANAHFDSLYLGTNKINVTNRLTLTNMLLIMNEEQEVMVPGVVSDIYDNGLEENINRFYLSSNNIDQIEFESWRGNVTTLTVEDNPNEGYLDAPLLPFITNRGACMIINDGSYWVTSVNGTNITFSPSLEENMIYNIEDINGAELKNLSVYGGVYGRADTNITMITLWGSLVRNWQGVSSHDGVTVYGAVDNNYIYKSIGWIDNSLLNKSYTIIIQPTTNAINKLQDIHIGENNNFIYYMLNTKTNEWSIYDTYHTPIKWRTVVSKIGDDWYYRNTNNVMEPSYTNEISTISMAINNNRYNRQRYFAYSGYLDYEHVEPLRISATFYNQATNQAPVLNAINLSTLSYPNEYKSNLSNYEITINSANSTNSIVKKLSPGTNNVIISYYQMLKDTE